MRKNKFTERFFSGLIALMILASVVPLQALAANLPYEQDPNAGDGESAYIELSAYPERITVGQNILLKARLFPASNGITVHFSASGIHSQFYQTTVDTQFDGSAYTTWVANQPGEAVISASATIDGVTVTETLTVIVLPIEETLRERFSLNYDMDFFIYSPPRWLGRNIHWNDPELTIIETNVNNAADKTLRVTFEDWIDQSYDDVTFSIDAKGDKIVITKERVNTACPDRTHLVLNFDTPKVVIVSVTSPSTEANEVNSMEVYRGTDFDILLWNHVVYDTWTQKTITIKDEGAYPDIISMDMTLEPNEVMVNNRMKATARVEDSNGFPVSGLKVAFNNQGVRGSFQLIKEDTVTDKNGMASIYFIPKEAGTGSIVSTVVYGGRTYTDSEAYVSRAGHVPETRLRILLSPPVNYAELGSTADYTVAIKDPRSAVNCRINDELKPYNCEKQTYYITLEGIPFRHKMENFVTLMPGQEKVIRLRIYVADIKVDDVVQPVERPVIQPILTSTEPAVHGISTVSAQNDVDTEKIAPLHKDPLVYTALPREKLVNQPSDSRIISAYTVNVIASTAVNSGQREAFAGSGKAILYVTRSVVQPPQFPDSPDTIEILLQPGWNLASIPGELIRFRSLPEAEKKIMGFVWMADTKEYVAMHEAQSRLGEGFGKYLSEHAFWIYSYQKTVISAEVRRSDSPLQLTKGWNLVPIRDYFIGRSVSSMITNCVYPPEFPDAKMQPADISIERCGVDSIYSWNAERQQWNKMSVYYPFTESDTGFVLKLDSERAHLQPPRVLLEEKILPD